MHDFADIDQRIERVCSLTFRERDDARIVAEFGEVLNRGYDSALQADARCRRLADRIDRLLIDGDRSGRPGELARERQALAEATRRLRDRLGRLGAVFAQVSARVDGAPPSLGQTSPRRTA